MIYANMVNTLTSIGVEEINCQDKKFDPTTHGRKGDFRPTKNKISNTDSYTESGNDRP